MIVNSIIRGIANLILWPFGRRLVPVCTRCSVELDPSHDDIFCAGCRYTMDHPPMPEGWAE